MEVKNNVKRVLIAVDKLGRTTDLYLNPGSAADDWGVSTQQVNNAISKGSSMHGHYFKWMDKEVKIMTEEPENYIKRG